MAGVTQTARETVTARTHNSTSPRPPEKGHGGGVGREDTAGLSGKIRPSENVTFAHAGWGKP